MPKKFEVFISYRRKGGHETAKLIYDRLRLDGYSVSFDIDTLENGNFDAELEQRVSDCKDFLFVLSPGVFDRFLETDPDCDHENDWVRREIACAIKTNKNIIPLYLDGFAFPKSLPDEIKDIMRKNTIDLYPKYFEAAYDKMKSFMVSKPRWTVKYKKIITGFISVLFIALAAFLLFTINQLREETEIKARTLDSIKQAREQRADQRQTTQKQTAQKPQKQTEQPQAAQTQATQPQAAQTQTEESKPSKKTLHWNGPSDAISQAVFEKIAPAEVQKTKCSENGININLNKAACEADDSEQIICSYSPKLTLTDCNGKLLSFLETSEVFKTSPQIDEEMARAELASELLKTNFSDWISVLKEEIK